MNRLVVAAWVALTAAGAAVATDCVTTENAEIRVDGNSSLIYKTQDIIPADITFHEEPCANITYCEDLCTNTQCDAYAFAQGPPDGLCTCIIYTNLNSRVPFDTLPFNGWKLVDCRSVTPLAQNRGACTVTAHQSYKEPLIYNVDNDDTANDPATFTNGWGAFKKVTPCTAVANCAEECIATPDCSAFTYESPSTTDLENNHGGECYLIAKSSSAVLVPVVHTLGGMEDNAYNRRSTGDCGPLPTPKPSPPPPAVPPAPPPESKKKSPWDWLGPILALVFIILVYIVYIVYRKCEKNKKSLASMTDSML